MNARVNEGRRRSRRPVLATMATLAALASAGAGAAEVSLQTVFNGMFGAASAPLATAPLADADDSRWTIAGSSGTSTMLIEIAGYAGTNTFGLYDPFGTATLRVFAGTDAKGSVKTIAVAQVGSDWQFTVGGVSTLFSSKTFGLYLDPQGSSGASPFYSDSSKNPSGGDQMRAYLGSDQKFLQSTYTPGGLVGSTFGSTDVIIAWEDIALANSDKDYQDMVLLMRSVRPATLITPSNSVVPLPAAVWLLGAGFLGYLGIGYTRRET